MNGAILNIGYVNSGEIDLYVIFIPKNKKVRQGVDHFMFYIKNNVLLLIGTPEDSKFDDWCNIDKKLRQNGRGCTAWVIKNGNMDYLHCNDLSWDGKHTCK